MGIDAEGVSAREAIGCWREDFRCFLVSIPFRLLVLPQHQGWVQRLHTSDGDRAHDTPRKSEFLPFVTSSLTFRRLEVNPALSLTRSHFASHQSFSITSARVDVAAPQALLPRLKSRQSAPNRPPLSKMQTPAVREPDVPSRRAPLDYPALTSWLRACEDDIVRGRDRHSYTDLEGVFTGNGFTRIDNITMLSPEAIMELAKREGLNVSLALVHRIFKYAKEDVDFVQAGGKLV